MKILGTASLGSNKIFPAIYDVIFLRHENEAQSDKTAQLIS